MHGVKEHTTKRRHQEENIDQDKPLRQQALGWKKYAPPTTVLGKNS
jgi:hypothetical protein